jgi:hypothetical protein
VQESHGPLPPAPAPSSSSPPDHGARPAGAAALARSLPGSLRRAWPGVAVPFWTAVSRIALGVVFAHLVLVLLPQARQHLVGGTLNGGTWLGAFDRWDSTYYVGIAQHGYTTSYADGTAFFPGYPLLVALVHGFTFGTLPYYQSAIVVSWAAFVAGAVVLYRLSARLYSTRVALIATVLFCWVPSSLFFLSPYSEGLFALLIVSVLALLERQRFLAAAVVAAFASATSPESFALTAAIVVAAVMAGKAVRWVVAYAAISAVGIACYMVFLWARYGNPFEFVAVQRDWGRSEHPPFVGLYRNILALRDFLVGPSPAPGGTRVTWANFRWVWLLDDAALVVAAFVVLALVYLCVTRWPTGGRRAAQGEVGGLLEGAGAGGGGYETAPVPVSFVVVSFLIVLLAACTTISPYAKPVWASSEGEARFVSVAMPLYVGAALVVRRSAFLVAFAVGTSVILALLFQAMYNLGYWVT